MLIKKEAEMKVHQFKGEGTFKEEEFDTTEHKIIMSVQIQPELRFWDEGDPVDIVLHQELDPVNYQFLIRNSIVEIPTRDNYKLEGQSGYILGKKYNNQRLVFDEWKIKEENEKEIFADYDPIRFRNADGSLCSWYYNDLIPKTDDYGKLPSRIRLKTNKICFNRFNPEKTERDKYISIDLDLDSIIDLPSDPPDNTGISAPKNFTIDV